MATRFRLRRWLGLLSLLVVLSTEFGVLECGELVMKSGLRLQPGLVRKFPTLTMDNPQAVGAGEDAIVIYSFWMLDDNMRRYWVHNKQLADKKLDVELAQWEKFEIKPLRKGGPWTVESVGPYLSVGPFRETGHREVTILGLKQSPTTLIQGITQLRPQSCTVTGLNHDWEFSIATSSRMASSSAAPARSRRWARAADGSALIHRSPSRSRIFAAMSRT